MQPPESNLVCQSNFVFLPNIHDSTQIVARLTAEITDAQAKTNAAKTAVEAWSHIIETIAELDIPLSNIKQQIVCAGSEAMAKLQAYLADVKNLLESRYPQTTSSETESAYVGRSFSYTEAGYWLKATERAFTAMNVLEKVETYAKNMTWTVKSIVEYYHRSLEEKTRHEVEMLTEYVQGMKLHLQLFRQIFCDAQPPMSSPAKWQPVHHVNLLPLHIAQEVAQNVINIAARLPPQIKAARAKIAAMKATVDRILPDASLDDISLRDYFIPIASITTAKLKVKEATEAWCHVTETVMELSTPLSEIKQQLIHTSNEAMTKLHDYLSTVKAPLESRCDRTIPQVIMHLSLHEDFSYTEAENWLRTTEQTFTAINVLEKVETYGKDIIQAVQGTLEYCNCVISGLNEQTSLEQTSTQDADTFRHDAFQNIRIHIALAAAGAEIDTEIYGMSTMEVKIETADGIKTETKVRVEAETITDYVRGIEGNMKLLMHILCDTESTDTHIK
jgi:hypothetical protein